MTGRIAIRGAVAAALALLMGCGEDTPPSETKAPIGTGGLGGSAPLGGSAGSMMMPPPALAGSGGSVAVPRAGSGGMAGSMMVAGSGGMAGAMMTAGSAGSDMMAGSGGMAGSDDMMAGSGDAGSGGMGGSGTGTGMCCSSGDCLCHGPEPTALTSMQGPYKTDSYTIAGTGCVFYPTDAEPPFAAVTVSDGFLGSGGCSSFQTGQWGPLYASWGIVAMIVNTGSSDQPNQRGMALTKGIEAFKKENTNASSPLNGKLAGRYGTSGFSMGGGGTTYAAKDDPTLKTNVAIMAWGPVSGTVMVPTLVICGSSDSTAPCSTYGTPFYNRIPDSVPKMKIQISSGHAGQPSSGMGKSGKFGLAFQKVFLEGDERWRPLLIAGDSEATNIK